MISSITKFGSNKSIFILIALFFTCNALTAFEQRDDFSGKWKLDAAKSEFGNVPKNSAVKQFEIQQSGDSVLIKRITVNANNEESTSTEKLSMDGKPCSYIMDNKKTKHLPSPGLPTAR